jgi:hypothetical protein
MSKKKQKTQANPIRLSELRRLLLYPAELRGQRAILKGVLHTKIRIFAREGKGVGNESL